MIVLMIVIILPINNNNFPNYSCKPPVLKTLSSISNNFPITLLKTNIILIYNNNSCNNNSKLTNNNIINNNNFKNQK